MTIVKHELKQGKTSFFIWTGSIGLLLAVCVFLFPEMKGQMDGVSEVFASMKKKSRIPVLPLMHLWRQAVTLVLR